MVRPPMYGDAVFGGPAGGHGPHRYRYLLWRCWEPDADQLTFVLCNPSTAGGWEGGALRSDPTVDRLIEIAAQAGAGGFALVNLVAHVEPDLAHPPGGDLEGPDNRAHLERVLALDNRVVVGWGARPRLESQRRSVAGLLGDRPCWCLGVNRISRTPMHPLPRGPKRLDLMPFEPIGS